MDSATMNSTQSTPARPRFAAPIWTLLLLAPFVSEVLSGSTRTSILFVFLPEVMVWGVGALLCRELVRRWRAGGVSLLMLGLALSIAEEFIIQQTSIAPLPFPGSHPDYGRMWGVNLVYLLFMLGFESVWVEMVPVQLAELFHPQKAMQPWLRTRGMVISCLVFLVGARIAWYGWTQQARPRLEAPAYHPPLHLIVLGFSAIAALIAAAYFLRGVGTPAANDRRGTVPAWVAGVAALLLGAPWFELIGQNFVPNPVQPFWYIAAAGVAWASVAFTLFFWCSSRSAWGESHRYAAACGATLACMAAPYLTISSWPRIDVVGLVTFDVLALVGFVMLGRKIIAQGRA